MIKAKLVTLNVADGKKALSELWGSTDAFSFLRVQSITPSAAVKLGDISLDANAYGIKLTADSSTASAEFILDQNKRNADLASNLYFLADADNCSFALFAY